MARAEFSGHCQACGRLQKAPNATVRGTATQVLALHGYKVAHGFFSGVCRGSKHQPFEVSCALIERFISEAQASSR